MKVPGLRGKQSFIFSLHWQSNFTFRKYYSLLHSKKLTGGHIAILPIAQTYFKIRYDLKIANDNK